VRLDVACTGKIADLKTHPITAETLVGLLSESLSVNVNQVNATHLAKRQGIVLSESRSAEAQDYLSLVTLTASFDHDQITMSGTLFDELHPRLVRINDYHIEAPLIGKLLFTRHNDQPGVVRDIGEILAAENINISTMQVGIAKGASKAVAIIGVSELLGESGLAKIRALPAVSKVLQVTM
jgi:D-3-phosphoglycerate dehydrogenase